MNLDFALVNRALRNIGMQALTLQDRQTNSEAWQTARAYYLNTMLEALAQVEWTSAKRRRELTPAQMPVKKNADFARAYALPLDCAKPVELDGQEYFEVEGALLYTDAAPARLLYVGNGRRVIDQEVISGGNAGRRLTPDYVTGGDADRDCRVEWGDNTVSGGNAGRAPAAPPEADEDYPDYRELRLEPNFYLYWECLLSSKYALRMTDTPGLSESWLNRALVYGRAAEVVSIAGSAGRKKAPDTWQEQLGIC